MLSQNLLVEGLGAENWFRVLSLLWGVPTAEGRGCLLVVYRGLRLLKAIDLASGRPVDVEFTGTSSLERLSEDSGRPLVVALEENALARVAGHAQRALSHDMDYFEQLSLFIEGLNSEWRRTIFTHPPGPSTIPIIPYRALESMLGMILPDSSILLLAATKQGKLWASAAIGWRDGDFWLLTSLESVGVGLGTDVEDELLRLAGDRLAGKYGGSVMTACAELRAIERIRLSRFPFASILWARNTSEIVLYDFPARTSVAALLAARLVSLRGVL